MIARFFVRFGSAQLSAFTGILFSVPFESLAVVVLLQVVERFFPIDRCESFGCRPSRCDGMPPQRSGLQAGHDFRNDPFAGLPRCFAI